MTSLLLIPPSSWGKPCADDKAFFFPLSPGRYFYANNAFVYTLISFALLAAVYFLLMPRDKNFYKQEDATKEMRRRRGKL
jgi:hypothetical protein